MSQPEFPPSPVRLADQITHQLGQLADQLSQLPAHQAVQVIVRVLDPDDEKGVLGAVTRLMVTGSLFAKDQAERGVLPAEVWLALGRASNELHDICLDLDEHHDTLRAMGSRPALAATAPSAASPLVVRRRR
ncbi:hypothetical protein [Streptomyces sp. UH6]|uniref:hypothetical protein n=1 Tax=Streptomyces sp. UH6 TaxID=2748379 RepID=UPI0015D4AD5D|nr:hypothetical protein [Streptomyces sp. UH6]NYV73261.1 hypothetical protein [Streptomyces sp. UH6]